MCGLFLFFNFYLGDRRLPCRSGPPVDGAKDPWPCVLSLPELFDGDPASLALDKTLHNVGICGALEGGTGQEKYVERGKCYGELGIRKPSG